MNRDIPSKDEVQGPLWTPTVAVERMMRQCKEYPRDKMLVDHTMMEGLLFDVLEHRKLQLARQVPPPETSGRKFTGVGELERTGYIPAGSAAERELAPSEAASFDKALANSRRIETPAESTAKGLAVIRAAQLDIAAQSLDRNDCHTLGEACREAAKLLRGFAVPAVKTSAGRCPKCNRDATEGCNYVACPYPLPVKTGPAQDAPLTVSKVPQ